MLKLTLCIAGDDDETQRLRRDLTATLADALAPGTWNLDVIDVIQMPEKALQNDVFVTPTLLREVPAPVLKLIGDIANTPRLLALIQDGVPNGQALVV
jgi:hypothetical protein